MSDFKSIDPTAIENLKELVDEEEPEFLTDLLTGYVDNVSENLPNLARLLDSADTVKAVKTAHSLKGASSNIGASHLAGLLKKFEEYTKEERFEEARQLLNKLHAEFEAVKLELNGFL